jgi:cytochrome oxidase assembly protein ShyY1
VHVLVGLLVVVMVNLGFWQLRRLDERRASNDQVRSRTTEQPVPIESVAAPDTSGAALSSLRYRTVTAHGAYDAGATPVPSRTQDGAPGGWVVSRLKVGSVFVLVLRGFAGQGPDGSVPNPDAPSGTVDVEGYALAISGFDNIAKHDLEALRAENPATLPVVLQAKESTPADDASLAAIPLPTLDDGPHLSYAIQWFLFSTVAVVGYPFALRRAASAREREQEHEET